jgi:hypothetical protein
MTGTHRQGGWPGTAQPGQDLGARVAAVCGAWPRVLAAPRVATFAAERARASWDAIGVGLALIAAAWVGAALLRHGADAALRAGAFHAGVALLSSGALFIAARVAGRGRGDYTTQTHLYLLYHAPLSIALAVVSVMPVGGTLATLIAAPLVTLYGLVVSCPMLQAAHGLSRGQAIRSLVALVAVAALLTLLALALVAAVVAAVAALVTHL